MMQLNVMQALEATLNETYQSDIADHIVRAWTHDHGPVHYVRASANFIFVFHWNERPCIVRFTHAHERSADAIRAELTYLQHLATHDIPVALPLRSVAGRYVETIATPIGTMHAVVFEKLAGEHIEIDDVSLEQFTQWGTALGRLHRAAQGYVTAGRPTVDDLLSWVDQSLPAHEHAARRMLHHVQRHVAALPRSAHNFGLIHYDFELDNLLWHHNQIGIVDFDDCAYCWFVADIAFALRDVCDDHADHITVADARVQAFLGGYRQARPVRAEELLDLPLFLRMHHLVSFVQLLRAANTSGETTTPEWVVTLQAKLMRKAERYRDEFAGYTA